MIRHIHLAILLSALAAAQAQTRTQTLFAPVHTGVDRAATPGSAPFSWLRPSRAQYCYDSAHFTTQHVAGPIAITSLTWRAADGASFVWPSTPVGQIRVVMSTATVDHTQTGLTFAANHGADQQVVFDRQVTLSAGSTVSYLALGAQMLTLTLDRPFLFDPALGDLIVDVASSTGAAPPLQGRVAGDADRCSHVYHDGDWQAATAQGRVASALALRFDTTPYDALVADFMSSVRSGDSPLAVSFTDRSRTTAPNGLTGWAWDFNGDGQIDSTLANPQWTFGPGRHSVALRVTNGRDPDRRTVRHELIVVDEVKAELRVRETFVRPGMPVQFVDASSYGPAAWEWDFDNDGRIDSTAQNPQWSYAAIGTYDVRLLVRRGLLWDAITKSRAVQVVDVPVTGNTASPEAVELQFNEPRFENRIVVNSASMAIASVSRPASNLRASVPWGFATQDGLGAYPPSGLGSLPDVEMTVSATVRSMSVTWWGYATSNPEHYVSFWSMTAGNVQSAAAVGFSYALQCSAGTARVVGLTSPRSALRHYAWVVDDVAGLATLYADGQVDGRTAFPPGTHALVNPILSVGGTSLGFAPRVDDFRVYLRPLDQAEVLNVMRSESPTATPFGQGCPGRNGAPTLLGERAPAVGAAFALRADHLEPGQPALLVLGSRARGGNLPQPLPFLGPTCQLECSTDHAIPFSTGLGTAYLPMPIPAALELWGSHAYAQIAVFGSVAALSAGLNIAVR